MIHTLDERQLATVLAALRYWQRNVITVDGLDVKTVPEFDIATDGGTVESLGATEIDTLCEELNGVETASPEYFEAARGMYAAPSNDDIEIDEDAPISKSDHGTWVMAWVHVREEDVPPVEEPDEDVCAECGDKVSEIIGCPDGREICQDCFDNGAG